MCPTVLQKICYKASDKRWTTCKAAQDTLTEMSYMRGEKKRMLTDLLNKMK